MYPSRGWFEREAMDASLGTITSMAEVAWINELEYHDPKQKRGLVKKYIEQVKESDKQYRQLHDELHEQVAEKVSKYVDVQYQNGSATPSIARVPDHIADSMDRAIDFLEQRVDQEREKLYRFMNLQVNEVLGDSLEHIPFRSWRTAEEVPAVGLIEVTSEHPDLKMPWRNAFSKRMWWVIAISFLGLTSIHIMTGLLAYDALRETEDSSHSSIEKWVTISLVLLLTVFEFGTSLYALITSRKHVQSAEDKRLTNGFHWTISGVLFLILVASCFELCKHSDMTWDTFAKCLDRGAKGAGLIILFHFAHAKLFRFLGTYLRRGKQD